jgi:hypothetical protein
MKLSRFLSSNPFNCYSSIKNNSAAKNNGREILVTDVPSTACKGVRQELMLLFLIQVKCKAKAKEREKKKIHNFISLFKRDMNHA